MTNQADKRTTARERRILNLLASGFGIALLPVLTLFVFGTFTLYVGNQSEFATGLAELWPFLLVLSVITWVILATPVLLLRGPVRDVYLCLLFAAGMALWIQGNFLTGHYGVLDGRGIEWQAFEWPAWADILLWLAVIIAALFLYRRLVGLLLPASLVLIAIQVVGAAQLLMHADDELWHREQPPTAQPPEEIFHYSVDHNIVHLVLDNFQTDVFEELITELELEQEFDGFTLFRETSAAAPYTSMAIPSIFKGTVYDGSQAPDEFFQTGMKEGFHSRLHDEGFRVNLSVLQTMEGSRYDHHYRIPNVYAASTADIARMESALILDVALFRHVPHLFRNWVYNDNNWRIQQWIDDKSVLPISFAHKQFFRSYTENIEPRLDGPAYHFVHLWPPHPPYVTTETGEYAGRALPNTRENYLNEARAILRYTVDFLDRLRQLDLYDDALILVHSDHGGAFEPEFTPTRMLTLMAVKPRGASGTLQTSEASVSLTDVGATVLDLAGIDLAWPGRSVFHVGEQEQRVRHYSFWHGEDNRQLGRVVIDGSLYSEESYTYTDSIEVTPERTSYQPGETVEVGLRGTGSMYLGRGWSTPEPGIAWNNGHKATLLIPMEPQEADLQLTLWLIPAIYDQVLENQRIRLYAGDQEVGRWELNEAAGTQLQTTIPVELLQSGELKLRFELPDAASQRELGVGGDQRLQGIALSRFRLE